MASVSSRVVVDAPRPLPPLYTLIGSPSTDATPPGDPHWTAGIQLVGQPTVDALDTYPGCAGIGSAGEKGYGDLATPDPFDAFTILLGLSCKTFVFDLASLQQRAEAAYTAYEHYPLERQVMAGTASTDIPYLADSNATIVGTAGMGMTEGVAELEDAIAATGRQGVIHCSPGAAAIGSYGGVFTRQGNQIVTINGTPVIPAQGYQGDTPEGENPGAHTEYIYASTPFLVRRGNVEVLDPRSAVIRETNDAVIWVERDYAYAWDQTLQVAANVDRTKE